MVDSSIVDSIVDSIADSSIVYIIVNSSIIVV